MKAGELLTTLTIRTNKNDYIGVYYQDKKQQLAFSHISINKKGFLVLYKEEHAADLSMKDFLKTLMLNKKRPLYYWNGKKLSLVFGFKEENGKLIL
ncbi:MAG TPA: hypothetical protein H9829_07025 [Candidatus Tetragenococcus pullicola]|nr:hypothetical protein [Candidatus Tetragenococcus pullicola]